jgi:hypothetical protein
LNSHPGLYKKSPYNISHPIWHHPAPPEPYQKADFFLDICPVIGNSAVHSFAQINFMKRIAIINGHPYAASFNADLVQAYKEGALQTGADIQEINIADLEFNPNLRVVTAKELSWSLIF